MTSAPAAPLTLKKRAGRRWHRWDPASGSRCLRALEPRFCSMCEFTQPWRSGFALVSSQEIGDREIAVEPIVQARNQREGLRALACIVQGHGIDKAELNGTWRQVVRAA